MFPRRHSLLRIVAASVAVATAVTFSAAVADDEQSPPAKQDNKHADLKQAQGTWDVVRHAAGGTGFGKRDGTGERIGPQGTIADEVGTFHDPHAPAETKSVYKIKNFDATTKPKHIDVAFEKDGEQLVRKGIYFLEKDLIKCEFAQPGRPRPEAFEASEEIDNGTNFLILRRVERKQP